MGKRLLNAFGFLTIVKIPGAIAMDEEEVSGSLVYFPFVGIMLGILLSTSFFLFDLFLPIFITVILVIILEVIITGAAHLDGLADMFDGVFSGRRKKEKILEIMKKSDVGVFGILSIVFIIILKLILIYYLYTSSKNSPVDAMGILYFYSALIFMPAFGRWSMTYLLSSYKNARSGISLADIFTGSEYRRKYFISSTIYLFVFYMLIILAGWYLTVSLNGGINENTGVLIQFIPPVAGMFIVTVFTVLSILFLGWFFTRRIGGITGDIVGGSSEIIEVLFLFMNYLVLNYLWN